MEKMVTSIVMLETDQPLLVYESGIKANLLTVLFLSSMISKLSLIEGRKEGKGGAGKERGGDGERTKREGKGREMTE